MYSETPKSKEYSPSDTAELLDVNEGDNFIDPTNTVRLHWSPPCWAAMTLFSAAPGGSG